MKKLETLPRKAVGTNEGSPFMYFGWPSITRLPDGTLVLACNPVGENWGARNPLSLLVSEDNGVTWRHLLDLAHEPGTHEFSYPCIIRSGSALHVTYTVDRTNIAYIRLETEE